MNTSVGLKGGHFVVALLMAVAAGVGVAISHFGWIALIVGMLPAVAIFTVLYPLRILVILALLVPVENAITVESLGTATKMVGLGLAAGWLLGKFLRRESWRRIATSKPLWAAATFLAFVGLSTLWAQDPRSARSGFVQLVQLFALAVITIDICQTRAEIEAVAKGLVLGGLAAAALTIVDLLGGSRRAGETVAGINGTAELLVTLLPVVFCFIQSTGRKRWRLVGLLYLAAGSAAVVATFSRMSVMLLPVVTGFLLFRTLKFREARRWLLPMLVAVAITGIFVIPWDRVESRVQTILPYLRSTFEPAGSAESPVMSGRGYHLLVGLKIFADHPVLGVGYENYGWYFLYRYQHQVPGAEQLWLSQRSPHSSHIGILSDLGLVGAAFWVVLLMSVVLPLGKSWRSLRLGSWGEANPLVQLQEGLLFALLLQVVPYALYGPIQKQKLFWLLLGLSVAVVSVARPYWRRSNRYDVQRSRGAYPKAVPHEDGIPSASLEYIAASK